MVDEPQKGSPAAEAGIDTGDIITAVNGTKVKDARELARTIGMLAPNTKAKLDIIRQGQEKSLTVTVGEMSNEHQAKADTEQQTPSSGIPHLGLSLAPASDVAGASDKGVVVMNVEPDEPAAEQGFERGHVILDVGGKPVANVGRRAQCAQRGQDPRQARRSHAREDGRCDPVRGRAARHCVRTAVTPRRWCRCLQELSRWVSGGRADARPLCSDPPKPWCADGPRQPTHRRDNARCKARSFRHAD